MSQDAEPDQSRPRLERGHRLGQFAFTKSTLSGLHAGLADGGRQRIAAVLATAAALAGAQWAAGGAELPADGRDVEAVETNRPRLPVAPVAIRAELRTPRLLPSLQPHPRWRQTLATLVPPRRSTELPVLYTTHRQSAPLALRATTTSAPVLPPDLWATGPDAWSAAREERFVLLLRGAMSEAVDVRLEAGGDALVLAVTGGTEERWLTLVIDGVIDDDGTPPVPRVRIGDQPVELAAWGYATRIDGEQTVDVRVISNAMAPVLGRPETGSRWGEEASWTPVALRAVDGRWVRTN